MKKAILLMVFCVLGCKTHKKIQKSETVKVDSVKTDMSAEQSRTITDSNISFLTGSVTDLAYKKKTVVTEYDTQPAAPTTEIVVNGFWGLPEKTDKGKVYTDVTDTSRKAVYDTTSKVVTIYKNGKVEEKIRETANTGLARPIKKQTVTDEEIKYRKQDSTLYWAQLHKEDSMRKAQLAKDSLAQVAQKSSTLDKGTKVSGWNIFIPLFIGLAILAIAVIFIYKKTK